MGGDKLSNIPDFLNDFFNAYKETSQYSDSAKLELAIRKKQFEDNLNEMWDAYRKGRVTVIVDYNAQVSEIKQYGYKVLRNGEGIHKIIWIKK